jgi:ADP-dependent phosphofructokinase/glucokinase
MLYRNLIMPKIKVATGLYSHWDSIIRIDKEILKWIKNSEGVRPNNIVLNSLEEVIYTLKESVKNGDSESLITKKVYNELNSLFPKRELRIGGNGNNMGRALFGLGLMPLVSYPIRPEKLMKASPNFKVALGNEFKTPKETIRNDPEYDHIIFESEKWRNILPWDLMTSQGIFDMDFLKLAFNPTFIDVAIISYAHLLLPRYKKRTDVIVDIIKSKRPKIHLEFGTGSEESMKYAMKRFSEKEACDSWGLNEKECKIYLKASSESIEDLMEAVLKAAKEYNLKRICVHGSKFAFSISKYDVKKEMEALEAGCFAAVKPSDKISQKGCILKKKLSNYNFCLVPSFFNPHLRKITGLGDTFAAVQAVKILG